MRIPMKRTFLSIYILIGTMGFMTGCFRQIAPEGIRPSELEEGLIAFDQGKLMEALKHFNAALKHDPENTEALFKRGIIFQKQERVDEAIASYRELIQVDRYHLKAHYNLANLYAYEKGDAVKAVFHYRRFLTVAPTHPLAKTARNRLSELTAEKKGLTPVDLPDRLIQPPTIPTPPPTARSSNTVQDAIPQRSFPQVVCIGGRIGGNKVEGSGFVIGRNGYILASSHQLDNATHLVARFQDGSTYPATVLSVSEQLDLALLQIPFEGVQPMVFNQEKSQLVGDPVFAVGCPLGLNHSVAQGIISAPERRLGGMRLLQTDVAINPGNSGGPLLNKRREVIGVVIGVLPKARGISFALPAEEARRFLGVTFFQIGTLFAEAKRYDEAIGALLTSTRFWPESEKAYSNLGEVYRRMKRFKEAETAFLKSVSYNPQYADAHYNLGILYDNHLRNRKKAALHYRKYLSLQPDASDAKEISRWLIASEKNQ